MAGSSSNFLTTSFSWIRKSLSEHDNISKSAPVTHQSSVDNDADDEEEEEVRRRNDSVGPAAVRGLARSTLWSTQRSFESASSFLKQKASTTVNSVSHFPATSPPSLARIAGPDPFLDDDDSVELDAPSSILEIHEVECLNRHLPARLLGSTWHLLFSTETHGFSLSTIYRSMANVKPGPAILVIRDTHSNRFGAYVSESLRRSDKCFGSGETFVFRLMDNPDEEPKIYKWSGEGSKQNNLFILCTSESLCIGVDDGKFSIFLDATLCQGRSQECSTFNNDPLTPDGDFVAATVEIWTFV